MNYIYGVHISDSLILEVLTSPADKLPDQINKLSPWAAA